MTYEPQTWEDAPARTTPLTAARLNYMETQYQEALDVLRGATPGTLDTLEKLATAINNDPAFNTTLTALLAAKAPLASPTFTGTVSGITKSMVGLGNVDNTSDALKPGFPKGTTGTKYRMVACTIRRVSTTVWEALTDSGHQPTGVSAVTIEGANRVRLTYDFTATKVVTFAATLDESFAASTALVRCGASVGTSFADVYFYTSSGGSTPVDPGTLSTAGANVWIFGVFEVA